MNINDLNLASSLGLLTAGAGLLEGQSFNQALRGGLGAYSLLDDISAQEEERRRQEAQQLNLQRLTTAAQMGGRDMAGNPVDMQSLAMAAAPNLAAEQIIRNQFAPKKPPTTADITNFQFAKQNGFTGSFSDFLQSQVPGGVTMNVPPTEIPPEEVTNIDISTAAQGDLSGIGSRVGNFATGLFGGSYDEPALREAANLRAVNLGAQVPLTKSLSDKGSVYTQQNIARLLPQPGDTNAQMVAKMESLIPLLDRQINEAKKVALNPNAQAAYRTNALEMLSSGPAALAAYKKAVENYRRREGQRSPVTRKTQRRVVRDPNTGEMRFVD
jgi:hypothetical protein